MPRSQSRHVTPPSPAIGLALSKVGAQVTHKGSTSMANKKSDEVIDTDVEHVEVSDFTSERPLAPDKSLGRAVVANGHTVEIPIAGADRESAGANPTGKTFRQPTRIYGPGQEVVLPKGEIRTLQEHGFLIDPNRVLP